MKKIFIYSSIIILLLWLGLGCYIPYHRHIHKVPNEKTLSSIKEGVTSKEGILMMLGEPDRIRNNERLFLYWWQEEYGYVSGCIGAPVMRTYSLHIEFDENNIVKNFEIKKKSPLDEFDEESE